jgi:hypothetical protein
MSNNIKKLVRKNLNTLLETKGFEHMEVAFGVKEKSDNLSDAEKKQFGSMETIQDEKGVKLGNASVQPALNKVHKEDKKDEEAYFKDVEKKMKDFQKTSEAEPSQIGEAFDPPKVNREDNQTEPEEVYSTEALGPGMLALKYDNEGTPVHDKFEERMDDLNGDDLTYKKLKGYGEKYLKHKYEAPDEYHYSPKVRTTNKPISEGMFGDDFDDIPSHRELIDGWLKDCDKEAINDYISTLDGPYKEDAQNYLKGKTPNCGGLSEKYSDVVKENIFKVKGTIKSKEQVINLVNKLPKRVRVDETVFAVTDGENQYRLIWEGGSNGEAVITHEKNNNLVNENIQKMKHLWGFKSSDTTKKTIKEGNDDVFFKMMNKVRGK